MKPLLLILIIAAWTMSCKDNRKKIAGNETGLTEQSSVRKTKVEKPQSATGIIYQTETLKLYGDTTIDRNKISHASIKFEPYIGFDDFKVNSVDNRKYADLDLKSNKDANNFRSRLREGFSSDTANFAGHYTFVYWACGSPCQSSLLIDRRSGKIYDSPGASVGYDFRVDSRILIVNPPDSNGFYYDCSYCKPVIYIFDEKTKIFKEVQRT